MRTLKFKSLLCSKPAQNFPFLFQPFSPTPMTQPHWSRLPSLPAPALFTSLLVIIKPHVPQGLCTGCSSAWLSPCQLLTWLVPFLHSGLGSNANLTYQLPWPLQKTALEKHLFFLCSAFFFSLVLIAVWCLILVSTPLLGFQGSDRRLLLFCSRLYLLCLEQSLQNGAKYIFTQWMQDDDKMAKSKQWKNIPRIWDWTKEKWARTSRKRTAPSSSIKEVKRTMLMRC